MTKETLAEKRIEVIYEQEEYKVIRVNGKEIWICKGCGKTFKYHTPFHKHNVLNCFRSRPK